MELMAAQYASRTFHHLVQALLDGRVERRREAPARGLPDECQRVPGAPKGRDAACTARRTASAGTSGATGLALPPQLSSLLILVIPVFWVLLMGIHASAMTIGATRLSALLELGCSLQHKFLGVDEQLGY